MKFRYIHSHHYLSERFNIDEYECQKLIKVIDKRHRSVTIIPNAAGLIACFIWMFIFGRGTDALEGTQWDILEFLFGIGPVGVIFVFFLGFGIAIILASITFIVLRKRLLCKQFEDHLIKPICFWCGYSLKGLESESNYIKCPECGERSRNGL